MHKLLASAALIATILAGAPVAAQAASAPVSAPGSLVHDVRYQRRMDAESHHDAVLHRQSYRVTRYRAPRSHGRIRY